MTASSTLPAPNLMPLMRYRDLAAAMSWLEQAFDFEKQIAVTDSAGAVIYGQMSYRGGLMMMGAVRDTDLDKLLRQPDEVGGVETQSCYLVVDDADVHYARALEAGAEVVLEIKSDGLGRRGYSCRDPEGHIWNFGTYNPGKGLSLAAAPAPSPEAEPPKPAPRRGRRLMGLAALVVGLGTASWWFADEIRSEIVQRIGDAAVQQSAAKAERAYAELVNVRADLRKADALARTFGKELEAERTKRAAIGSGAQSAADKVTKAEARAAAAEAEMAKLRDDLARQKVELAEAIEARRVSEEKLAVKAAETAAEASARADAERQAKAASQAVAGPQETPPEPAAPDRRQMSATSAASKGSNIETSANKPAEAPPAAPPAAHAADETPAQPRAADDDGDEKSAPAPRRVAKAGGKAVSRRPRVATQTAPQKYPEYHVDVKNVWPYNGWVK